MTLFDRYLLTRYLHAFAITFASMLGLYIIIDVFTNVDEFTDKGHDLATVVANMGKYYGYRTCQFFATIGSMVSIVAAVLTLAVVQWQGELSPILSAGVPTYRLVRPLIIGTIVINLMLVGNQELIIPRIAHELQARPGQDATSSDRIRPVYDFSTHILIAGGSLSWYSGKLYDGEFVLPVPEIAHELTTIRAKESVYLKGSEGERSGWMLTDPSPEFDEIGLTALGRETIVPGPERNQIFIRTDISFDQLKSRNKVYAYLSTQELLDRVQNPSFGTIYMRAQSLHLHSRFTTPLLNVFTVLLIVPVVVRRESRGLVVSLAYAIGAVLCVIGATQAFQYLGGANLIRLDIAAWAPLLATGTLSAWFTGMIRT